MAGRTYVPHAHTPGLLASVPAAAAEVAVRTERTNADEMLRERA